MEWLILACVVVLLLPREFSTYSAKLVGVARVEYGAKRRTPAVRITVKLGNAQMIRTETFERWTTAEEYFHNFGQDELNAILNDVITLTGGKS
jgi:hypothetical protein